MNNISLDNNNNRALRTSNAAYFDKKRRSWRVEWRENGTRKTKSFSIKNYGSDEEAKKKALEHRQAMNEITATNLVI